MRTQDIRRRLLTMMGRHRIKLNSCGCDSTRIYKVICVGFFMRAARRDAQEGLETLIED